VSAKCLPVAFALARPSSQLWKISASVQTLRCWPAVAIRGTLSGVGSEVSIASSRLTKSALASSISSVSLKKSLMLRVKRSILVVVPTSPFRSALIILCSSGLALFLPLIDSDCDYFKPRRHSSPH